MLYKIIYPVNIGPIQERIDSSNFNLMSLLEADKLCPVGSLLYKYFTIPVRDGYAYYQIVKEDLKNNSCSYVICEGVSVESYISDMYGASGELAVAVALDFVRNRLEHKTVQKQPNIKQENTMEKFKVTRAQMKVIHSIACNNWKTKIDEIVSNHFDSYENEAELPIDLVKSMFDSATESQRPYLNQIFPKYVEGENPFIKNSDNFFDIENLSNKIFGKEAFQLLRGSCPDDMPHLLDRAFFVSGCFKVRTAKAKNSGTVIYFEKIH